MILMKHQLLYMCPDYGCYKPNISAKLYYVCCHYSPWWGIMCTLFDVTAPPAVALSSEKLPCEASRLRLAFGLSAPGVVAVGLIVSPSSFFWRLSFARLFWNQTWTTRMSRPVSWASCSRTCLEGFELALYDVLRISSCFAVMVVRGLFWLPSASRVMCAWMSQLYELSTCIHCV